MKRICILGGGNMGSTLVAGILASGDTRGEQIAVFDPSVEARERIKERFADVAVLDLPEPAEGAILAMKPAGVEAACRALEPECFERILSIAAGVTLASLESWLWPGARIVRAMPNTPAMLGAGASVIAPGKSADDDDLAWAESVLSSVGIVVRLDESALDAVAGLSGSGTAYLFYLAEALIAAGVEVGLSSEVSRTLTNQTLLGAARMLIETDKSAGELRAAVTSPSGTTEAGIGELERLGVAPALIAAVRRATERSHELGRLNSAAV